MNSRLWVLSAFAAVMLSSPAMSLEPGRDTGCKNYLQNVAESAEASHAENQLLAAISDPYYLIPGAWFLSLAKLFESSSLATVLANSQETIAVTAMNYQNLTEKKKCSAMQSLQQQFEKALGIHGTDFLLYHYTSPDSLLVLDYISGNMESLFGESPRLDNEKK